MARILIVDVDPALLRTLSLRLKYEGHTPTIAKSGPEALSLLDYVLPHLLITDMMMPGMDGLELFEVVQRRFPLIPVLMLTAYGTIPSACVGMQRGLFGYLAKPFEKTTL